MQLRKFFILSFIGSMGISSLIADPVAVNPRPRMLSMGGAGLAALGDKDSAMMNPAGLNDVTSRRIEVLPITIEVPFEVSTLSSYLDFKDKIDKTGATSADKRKAAEEFLNDVSSKALGTRVNLYPSWTAKNFHIGLMADFYVNPRFGLGGVTANQVIEMGGSNGTAGLILGSSYAFLDGALQVGVTLKPLYRLALTREQAQSTYDFVKGMDPDNSITDEILGKSVGDRRAFGIGGDIGVKYFIPYFEDWKPTVGITYQDIGNTRFVFGKKLPQIQQSLSVGFAIHPNWSFIRNTIAVDFRNLNEEQEFENKIHLGVESVFWNLLIVRAGLSQLYWTAGLGIDTRFFELDAYVAAKEVGEKAHIQSERVLGTRIAFAL